MRTRLMTYILGICLVMGISFSFSVAQEFRAEAYLDSIKQIHLLDTIPYSQKIMMWNRLEKISIEEGNKATQCWALMNLGMCYIKVNAFKVSQEYISKAWKLTDEENDNLLKVQLGLLLGNFFIEIEDYDRALRFLQKSETLLDSVDRYNDKVSVLNGLGLCYADLNQFDRALQYYQKSLVYSDSASSSFFKAIPLINMAPTMLELDYPPEQIIGNLQEAIEISGKLGSAEALAEAYNYMGKVHFKLKDFTEAESFYLLSNEWAQKRFVSRILILNAKDLSKLYQKTGQLDKALEMNRISAAIRDSVYNEKMRLQLTELQSLFEIEKTFRKLEEKEAYIKLMDEKRRINSLQDYLITISLAAALLVLFVLMLKYRGDIRRKRQMHEITEKLMQSEIARTEMERGQLQHELKLKNRELTDFAIDLVRKREFTLEILKQLKSLSSTKLPENRTQKLTGLIRYIREQLSIDEGLNVFQENIEMINSDFFIKLQERYPGLTKNEKELCGLIRLNLSNKEIAIIKKISPDSAKVNRHRLRKKIKLDPSEDIVSLLREM